MNFILFDIETVINFFYIYFYNIETEETFEFEFSEITNNIEEFKKYLLLNSNHYFVGFNSLKYDGPLLTFVIDYIKFNITELTNEKIFNKSTNLLFNNDNYPIKYLKHLDLAEIGGYNTKATAASLKMIEFNLRLPNIENLPFDPTKPISINDFPKVKKYCKTDVMATKALFYNMTNEINIRMDKTYKDILNLPNTKLGESIVKQELGLNSLYVNREHFEPLHLKNVIFPYIEFTIPVFKTLKEWLSNQIITKPKGTFTEIPFENLKLLEGYYIKKIKKGTQKNLNVWFQGIQLNFGTGGLHASKKGIYTTTSKRIIIDIDVKSFYPFLAIENSLIPKSIKEFLISIDKKPELFLTVYKGFAEKRKLYPKPHSLNTLYKLALNIIFGKSLQPSSIFGDLEYGMKTTINGQLSLLMIIEGIYKNIPDIELIQVNTDGITLILDREYTEKLQLLVKKWEDLTKLKMEFATYQKMIIANVNNYLALYENGKIKQKGAMFSYKDLEQYKNHSMLIVPKALETFYIHNVDYKIFVKNHDNFYDFCKRIRLKKNNGVIPKLVYRTKNTGIPFEENYGKITRYIVAKQGGELVKIMPPLKNKTEEREISIEKGYKTIPMNFIDKTENLFKLLDYNYYIKEIEKIRLEIEPDFLDKQKRKYIS